MFLAIGGQPGEKHPTTLLDAAVAVMVLGVGISIFPRLLAKDYRPGAENLHMMPVARGTERYEKRFGVTAVEMGYITADQLVEALRAQIQEDLREGKHRLLGQILREQELMSPDDVERVLRKSLNQPIAASGY